MFQSTKAKIEFYCLLATALVVAISTIWVRTATVRDTYSYVKQEKKLKNLQREIQYEKIRWLKLTAPERLERFADSLDLHPPRMDQLLRYSSVSKRTGENQ
ncbi:MAG: hypothetical protein H6617_11425 [Bdellovibrionaceae bacterium]|nr:hypothetical protein [Bdellovibrionales bacterium]MCB9255283.1 hypothetical protein [Pseudobdellovibrionaceae bacterium]